MGTLTVRENLMFSANLRLPVSLSQKDKRQRVSETIEELGLTTSADTKVSHVVIYTVSPKNVHLFIFQITLPKINRFL